MLVATGLCVHNMHCSQSQLLLVYMMRIIPLAPHYVVWSPREQLLAEVGSMALLKFKNFVEIKKLQ